MQPLLSGYGVELSVKSTEYKAMDDSKVQGVVMTTTCHVTCVTMSSFFVLGDESRTVDQSQGEDEVEGFLFNTLRYSMMSCTKPTKLPVVYIRTYIHRPRYSVDGRLVQCVYAVVLG